MLIFHRTKAGCSGFFRPRSRRNSFSCKLQIPIPKSQVNLNFQIQKSNHSFLETIEEKISVNSRASPANSSRYRAWLSLNPHQLVAKTIGSPSLLFGKSSPASRSPSCSKPHPLQSNWPRPNLTRAPTAEHLRYCLGFSATASQPHAPIRRIERCDPRDLSVSCRRPFWSWDLILYLGFGFGGLGF